MYGRENLGWAWLGLTAALAVHVADEALNDFLSVYNPQAEAIREQLPWLPIPTFTFGVWLSMLIFAVAALAAATPAIFWSAEQGGHRARFWVRFAGFPYGVVMLANGLGHIGISLAREFWMPGVYSSPLLLAASAWLLWCLWGWRDKLRTLPDGAD
jgi:hypothetical protein